MEILYFDELGSTQKYLIEEIRSGRKNAPLCVVAKKQTDGIGSRENKWEGFDNNLFFSFAMRLDSLTSDLPKQSICIYLLYIFKECLKAYGSEVKIKWPNDLYLHNKKICGAMTNILKDTIVCGIGLNTDNSPQTYGNIDVPIDKIALLSDYFDMLEKAPSWGVIFSKYEVEFSSQKEVYFGDFVNQGQSVKLDYDGSLIIDGKKVFGAR